MTLELKHIAPYLSYGLYIGQPRLGVIEKYQVKGIKDLVTGVIVFIDDSRHGGYMQSYIRGVKPILRPLSDLTKEIEVNGERFVPILRMFGGNDYEKYSPVIEVKHKPILGDYIYISVEGIQDAIIFGIKNVTRNMVSYEMFQHLFEWHFDVFGLIEKGLAVDINTLSK